MMTTTNPVLMATLQATQEPSGGVAGWAVDLMERLGPLGAGLAVALEILFPPLLSEVILPLAVVAAARGDLGLVSAIVFTTLGSVVGALALYGVGAVLGRDRTRAIAEKPYRRAQAPALWNILASQRTFVTPKQRANLSSVCGG